MAFDDHVNFAAATITTAPSPATSGTTFTMGGTNWPTPPFNVTVWPSGQKPSSTNAEIIRVLARTGGNVTACLRAQEGTTAKTVTTAFQVTAGVTAKTVEDIEQAAGGYARSFESFGGKMDFERRYSHTMTSGSANLFDGEARFTPADVGKVVYVESAGTSRSFTTAGSVSITNALTRTLLTVTGGDFASADAGSIILVPGAGPAGATLVTHIVSVVSATQVVLQLVPTASVTNQTVTVKRTLRSTISLFINASNVTLANAAASTTSGPTGEGGGSCVMIGTDNAAAFTAIGAFLTNGPDVIIDWATGRYKNAPASIEFGPGACYTSGGDAFGTADPWFRYGWVLRGQGIGVTTIAYGPTSGGQYLFFDTDEGASQGGRWNNIAIEGIAFAGIGALTPGFYRSTGLVAQQGHRFTDCAWLGVWGRVFDCDGGDVNDKWIWDSCDIRPSHMDTFYYIPDTAAATSNQLHFQFIGGIQEWTVGDWFDMGRGGDIKIISGPSQVISHRGTYFKLHNSVAAAQPPATQRLVVVGQRFERRRPGVLLVDSTWDVGSITFDNCTDTGTLDQAGGTSQTDVGARFARGIGGGKPLISFKQCVLKGRHEYVWAGVDWDFQRRIIYDQCEFLGAVDPKDAFLFTNEPGDALSFNVGALPPVEIKNCRGDGTGSDEPWDTVLNWRQTRSPLVRRKVVAVRSPQGALVAFAGNPETLILPLNSVVQRLSLYIRNGDNVGATFAFSWTVQTTEGTPTVLGTVTLANAQTGGYHEIAPGAGNLPFLCDTTAKATLHINAAAGNDRQIVGDLLVEYI